MSSCSSDVIARLIGAKLTDALKQTHAARFNTFCVEYLNAFLNFHRPCLFATILADGVLERYGR